MNEESSFNQMCIKYKWWWLLGGIFTLGIGIGIIGIIFGIIGFAKSPKTKESAKLSKDEDYNTKVGSFDLGTRLLMSKTILGWNGKCPECQGALGVSKCNSCGADVQKLAAKYAREEQKAMREVNIPSSIMKKSVRFLGGHKDVPEPVYGWLGLLKDKIIFKNELASFFEIGFKEIKNIQIVDDNYTPSLARGVVTTLLGGDTNSQSFRPHKTVLQVTYDTGKRNKELCFEFNSITWAGAVQECQQFYSKMNAMLD